MATIAIDTSDTAPPGASKGVCLSATPRRVRSQLPATKLLDNEQVLDQTAVREVLRRDGQCSEIMK